jgi:hypothetical protein
MPQGINLGFGPIGAAVGPWIAAGTIMHKFRHVNGVSLSDLHDFYPDGNDAYCTNQQCGLAPAHDLGWGMGKSERRWKTCEDSCWYFADANDCRAAITGAKVFLGAISLGLLPLAYAIGNGVKNAAGERRRKFEFEVQAGARYLTPQVGSKWEPDANKCSFCETAIGSKANIFKRIGRSSSRHHCRLCGKNYCGEHCSIKVPMIAPLEPGHEVTSESGRKVHGKYKFTRYFLYVSCDVRVVLTCLSIGIAKGYLYVLSSKLFSILFCQIIFKFLKRNINNIFFYSNKLFKYLIIYVL